MAIIDKYSKEELENIVKNSYSLSEVIIKLGYATRSGSNNETVKKRLEQYKIDTSHFVHKPSQKRSAENVFIENSTASQATLRRWYKKGNYTEYKCSICNQLPYWQNKELTLILDHIDGNNKNHKINNLRWVCPNCNQQLETTGYKQMRVQPKNDKKYYCLECGSEISKDAKYCSSCAQKIIEQNKQNNIIEKEKLKQLLFETKNFSAIGRLYNVSDNAVRKWCDKYNLPRTIRDIKQYIKEQWELL